MLNFKQTKELFCIFILGEFLQRFPLTTLRSIKKIIFLSLSFMSLGTYDTVILSMPHDHSSALSFISHFRDFLQDGGRGKLLVNSIWRQQFLKKQPKGILYEITLSEVQKLQSEEFQWSTAHLFPVLEADKPESLVIRRSIK